ncbi:hypothetical protein ACVW00_002800 [Marmoricola sp. URHA0025 HA25]
MRRRLGPAAGGVLALACVLAGCGDAGNTSPSGQPTSGAAEPSVLPVGPSASASGAAPYAWINGPYVVRLGKALELDGSGSYARAGALVKYAWDLDGDGSVDEVTGDPRVTHTYTGAFDGLVTMTVTDADGRTTSATTHVAATPDGDEVGADTDNCPKMANPGQEDTDHDGAGDVCDPSPGWPTQDQLGVTEGSGQG